MSEARSWEEVAPSRCVGGGALSHLVSIPGDERLWLSRIRQPGEKLVLCLGQLEDGVFHERARGELPLKETTYVTGSLLYYDTVAGRLRFVYKEGFGEQPLSIFEVQGEQLRRVKTKGGGKTSSYDALSYDPKRSVLVHVLQMGRHGDEEGIRLRELHAGKWRDAGELQSDVGGQSDYVWAGWDGARKLTVVVDDGGACAGWDGSRWHELPELPGGCWLNPRFAQTREGRLTMVFDEREHQSPKKLLRVLGDKGWLGHRHDGLVACGPGALDPRTGRARYLDATFAGKGRCLWTEVEVAGEKLAWRLVPPYLPAFSGLTAWGGELLLWGSRPMYRCSGEAVAVCPAPAVPLLGLLGGEQIHAVAETGAVYLRRGDGWKKQPSKSLGTCEAAALARRPDGSILLCGGRERGYGKVLKQTWSWSGKGWTKLATKGRQPQLARATAAWDAGRGRLVVTGGMTNRSTERATYELDGRHWQRFDGGLSLYDHEILAYDGPSGLLFAAGYGAINLYRGEGRWEERTLPHEARWGSLAYDAAARQLWWADEAGGIARLDLGPWLDAQAAAARAPSAAAAGKPVKPKRPRAKKEPAQRYLRCTDDGADKFWIAGVEGSTVTLHWGRRGRRGQRKTHRHDSPRAARADFDKRVAQKLEDGYWDAPEKEKACEIPGRWAHRMSFGGRAVDVIGGLPRLSAERWPACADCGHPLSHVLTLRRHNERLPLQQHAGLAAFMCLHEDSAGSCATYEAFSGANAVLLLSAEELQARPRRAAPAGASPLVKRLAVRYERVFEPDPESEDTPYGKLVSKAGGYPVWYQGDETPACRECGAAMRFAAQLDEVSEPLNFGGDGVAYVFVCPGEHEGAFLWQCG